jgi:uncharacterized RDD family membrane protein YckC
VPTAEQPSGAAYASFGQRVLAEIVDSLIIGIGGSIVAALMHAHGDVFRAVEMLVGFGYNWRLDGSESGQTVGKGMMHIRVIADDSGGALGMARGATRAGIVLALGLVANLGFGDHSTVYIGFGVLPLLDGLWPLWDARRQTWHDKAAGSVVVQV